MNNNVELKVNVINQLKLLRQSTFKDKLCFLDEDFQNAQRSKAKNVKVTIDIDSVIIENDGEILKDPQCLFSIAESGWDKETQNTENPFGMGFFSNITVSSNIEIYSGNIHIQFDVENMIKTNDTSIKVNTTKDYYDGFKLILNNFDFDNIFEHSLRERVENLGKYIQELNVYCDGQLQNKKNLTEGDNSIFQIKIEEESIKGWLALKNGWDFFSGINIYYKGRMVCKLDNFNYIKGDLHINNRVLNLTSPDRKDIIRDNKYKDFKKLIKLYISLLCEDALLNGDEDDIQYYADAIGFYIDKNNIKDKIKFVTFKSKNLNDIQYLKEIAIAKQEEKNIKSFKNYQLYLKSKDSIQSESHIKEIEIDEKVVELPPEAKGSIVHEASSSYNDGYIEQPEIKEEDTENKNLERIINNEQPTFWMTFDEISQFEYKLNVAKHYDLKIIIARNKVESEILKNMKDTYKVLHISELLEDVELKGYLSNTSLNIKEQRGMMLLNLISRILEFDHNIFTIGDLMVTKVIKVESLNIKNEIIEDSVVVLRNSLADKVYIDRSIFDMNDIEDNLSIQITLKDYKFILANIYNIVKQVGVLCKGKTEDEIMQEILLALGQGSITI